MKTANTIGLLFILSFSLTAGEINTDRNNIAISAYDAVAYHLLNDAVQGKSEFSLEWRGVLWYFSSREHKELFRDNPEKYAPVSGGYCVNGLSDKHKIGGNPEIWLIQEGKLYFFFSRSGRQAWIEDSENKKEQAEEYWSLVQFD